MKYFLVVLLFLTACASKKAMEEERRDNPQFAAWSEQFLKQYWEVHPDWAAQEGVHEFDSQLVIFNIEKRERSLEFYKNIIEQLKAFPVEQLSSQQEVDKSIIENQMNYSIWSLEKLRQHEWDPSIYNLGSQIGSTIYSQRSLEDRLIALSRKLLHSRDYYTTAREQIHKPVKELVELAIEQNRGLRSYLKRDIKKLVRKASLSRRDKRTLMQRIDLTSAAAKKYIRFLNKILQNPNSVGGYRDFRLGKELYDEKFTYELQVEATPEEVYQNALDAKNEAFSKIFQVAISLYPKYFGEKLPPKERQLVISQVIDKVSLDYVPSRKFLKEVDLTLY